MRQPSSRALRSALRAIAKVRADAQAQAQLLSESSRALAQSFSLFDGESAAAARAKAVTDAYTALAIEVHDLGDVHAWLTELELIERTSESARCTAGRNHRVREVDNQGDSIHVERCRCGASRVRDWRTGEVTDWARPVLLPLPSDSEPSSDA